MNNIGAVISYDTGRGAGVLKADAGNGRFVFAVADQSEVFPHPRLFERYSFDVLVPADGGQSRAVNLRRQLSHREQAERQAG